MTLFIVSACDGATNAAGLESMLSVGAHGETPPTPAESQSRSSSAFFSKDLFQKVRVRMT
jgi:hypothetical protein